MPGWRAVAWQGKCTTGVQVGGWGLGETQRGFGRWHQGGGGTQFTAIKRNLEAGPPSPYSLKLLQAVPPTPLLARAALTGPARRTCILPPPTTHPPHQLCVPPRPLPKPLAAPVPPLPPQAVRTTHPPHQSSCVPPPPGSPPRWCAPPTRRTCGRTASPPTLPPPTPTPRPRASAPCPHARPSGPATSTGRPSRQHGRSRRPRQVRGWYTGWLISNNACACG